MRFSAFLLVAPALLVAERAYAEVINVSPSDSFEKIESAKPGDEVVIAPGTYKYRVYLDQKSTASAPLKIRAQDPKNPPVWDFGSTLVEDADGSYDGGDRGRSCWMIDGAENITISGLVFQHCRNAGHNSAGIRYVGGSKGIVIRDTLFKDNDNGLTGGNEKSEALVEHCEFNHNGNEDAGNPTHNIYIYSGTFALRYSYVHDSVQGQNFHIRASKSSLDYNWFARAARYAGDLMQDDESPSGPSTQEMLFRGNVVIQGNQSNDSQLMVLSHEGDGEGGTDVTMKIRVINNTFVLTTPDIPVIHLPDEEGVKIAEFSNNLLSGGKPLEIESGDGSATGTNNWFVTGTDVGDLTGSVFGSAAPFKNAANKDFTLVPGSNAIGAASQSVTGLPDREYFQNETVIKQYRVRATAKDIGAFESTTTGAGIDAYGTAPPGGPGTPGGGGDDDDDDGNGNTPDGKSDGASGGSGDDGGCGCRTTPSSAMSPMLVGLGLAAIVAGARRRRSK